MYENYFVHSFLPKTQIMSKEQEGKKKSDKTAASKTPKEKKAEKRQKKLFKPSTD